MQSFRGGVPTRRVRRVIHLHWTHHRLNSFAAAHDISWPPKIALDTNSTAALFYIDCHIRKWIAKKQSTSYLIVWLVHTINLGRDLHHPECITNNMMMNITAQAPSPAPWVEDLCISNCKFRPPQWALWYTCFALISTLRGPLQSPRLETLWFNVCVWNQGAWVGWGEDKSESKAPPLSPLLSNALRHT